MAIKYVYLVSDVKSEYPSEIALGVFDSYDAIIDAFPDVVWSRGSSSLIDPSKKYEVDELVINKRYVTEAPATGGNDDGNE